MSLMHKVRNGLSQKDQPVLALDADGVLLDYHAGYRLAWKEAFGEWLSEEDPSAYWAPDRWGARRLTDQAELDHLRSCFDAQFWSSLPAMEGALKACQDLDAAGYRLVCVTALSPNFTRERLGNLKALGFPIEEVVATGEHWEIMAGSESPLSPKARSLREINPVAFVDDHAPFLRGVPTSVHCALVLGSPNGSPNVGADLELAHSQHTSLLDFSKYWLRQPQS